MFNVTTIYIIILLWNYSPSIGCIDCISWNGAVPAQYQLPSISFKCQERRESAKIQVGDLVRILGWIKCVSIFRGSAGKHWIQTMNDSVGRKTIWEARQCVREIHVHQIECLEEESFVKETVHWLRCLQFARRVWNTTVNEQHNKEIKLIKREEGQKQRLICEVDENFDHSFRFQCRLMKSLIYNSTDFLKCIVPTLQSENVPLIKNSKHDKTCKTEDDAITRAYFGRDCTCTTTYKNTLLYCHCLATREPLDKELNFRDALLDRLLALEMMVLKSSNSSINRSNGMETNKLTENCQSNTNVSLCFQFSYQIIVEDRELNDIASQAVSSISSTPNSANVRRLYTNTFHWLRNDGVIHLLNDDDDIYVLLSKDKVLLPSMRKLIQEEEEWGIMESIENLYCPSLSPPSMPRFLQDLPFAKRRVLRKMVIQERK